MIPRYLARELAAMSKPSLWAIPDGPVEVVFDPLPDGTEQVLVTDSRPTIFSAYMWRLYVEYPLTPTKISHHLGTARLTNNSHMKLLNAVMWDCHDAYNAEVDLEEICKMNYEMTNAYYNDFTTQLEHEVSTISILDLIEVVNQPQIAEAIAAITGSPASIGHAHTVAETVLNDSSTLPHNPISASVRSNLVSMAQVKQCLIARGAVTEIDSRYFAEAIPSSFLSGMTTMIESMMESRSSTKAAAYKEKPIKDSEYFNRRLQLLAATVQQVEYVCNSTTENAGHTTVLPGDCGSTRYVRWTVKARDLESLNGKYYMSDRGLALVGPHSRELIGTTIQMRSPLRCMHESPQAVCAVCYGDLALSLPRGTNIGHVASVEYGEGVTQKMLSIKHVDFASGIRKVILGPYEREFLAPGHVLGGIRLLPKHNDAKILLSVAPADAEQLSELQFVKEDVTELPVGRVSEISEFYMTLIKPDGGKETVSLNVESGGSRAHFTHAMLAHIQQHGYSLSDTGRYLISLDGFDREQSIFELPNRDENILDYLDSVIQFISSTDEKNTSAPEGRRRMLKHCRSVEEALLSFHELTSAKMAINVVHLEILIYATLIRSGKERDYRLPQVGNALQFGRLLRILENRSLGAALAFEKHSNLMTEPTTYTNKLRTDHPLDDLVVPRGAVH